MKTLILIFAAAAFTFAQTPASKSSATPAPAAKDSTAMTTPVKKHTKKHAKKTDTSAAATSSATPAAKPAPAPAGK